MQHLSGFQLAPQVRFELTTLRLTAECSAIELLRNMECGSDLLSRAVTSQVPSTCWGLTTVFGMGTGGTLRPLPPQRVNIFNLATWQLHMSHPKSRVSIIYVLALVLSSNQLKSSYRPISITKLHTLLHFHRWPIYLVVFKGSLMLAHLESYS